MHRVPERGEGGGIAMRQAIGGMQSARLYYSIYCPICGKPAARVDENSRSTVYLHFTKKGSKKHVVERDAEKVEE